MYTNNDTQVISVSVDDVDSIVDVTEEVKNCSVDDIDKTVDTSLGKGFLVHSVAQRGVAAPR